MGRVRVFRITEDFDSPFTNGKRPKRKVVESGDDTGGMLPVEDEPEVIEDGQVSGGQGCHLRLLK